MPFPHPSLPKNEPRHLNTTVIPTLLGSTVVGCVITWWICIAQKVTVRSEGALESVRFGFPFPWVTQNVSHSPYISYPQEIEMMRTGRKVAVQTPTDYEWLAFVGNSLVWGAVVWIVAFILLPRAVLLFRTKRA